MYVCIHISIHLFTMIACILSLFQDSVCVPVRFQLCCLHESVYMCRVFMYGMESLSVGVCTCVVSHAPVHLLIHACMCACTFVWVYVCMYVRMFVCMCVCMYICMYLCI
jgi:hypothetical protein